jgi:hypothetical protein
MYVLVVHRCMSSSSSSLWDSGMLENVVGEEVNEKTGEWAMDSVELTTEEESDEHSGGSLLGVFLGRLVSDVVVEELAVESGGD